MTVIPHPPSRCLSRQSPEHPGLPPLVSFIEIRTRVCLFKHYSLIVEELNKYLFMCG